MDARDNKKLNSWEQTPCNHCGKYKTFEGHDGCISELDGLANACCGHGDPRKAYVQFFDGSGVWGEDAVVIQNILKMNRSDIDSELRIKFLEGSVRYLRNQNKFGYFKKVGAEHETNL